ncbi:MAG TPA: hypothetical protein VMG62_04545 [Solirubrobacteraceae bacterium]|nr:hypothetical protein [Solirubrobacteraceae bacterium]
MQELASRVIGWLGPENPERVVYGVILVGALLATESGLHERYSETVVSVVIALGVYWLAHSYAILLGGRLSAGEHLTPRALAQALGREWAIVRGACIPLVPLVMGWLVGAPLGSTVSVAIWAAVGCIVALELVAGLSARAGAGELALEGGVGIVMGVGILALKAIA